MDDPNAWDCSLCTYKNKSEAFRCSMCSGRKGTSTRKPRINQEVVTQQVLRQQEQIKQQALKAAAKPRDKVRRIDENSNSSIASTSSSRASPSPHSGNSSSNGSNSFLGTSSSFRTASKSNTVHRKARQVFDEIDDEEDEEEEDEVDENDIHQPGPSRPHNGHTNAGCNGNKNGKRKRDKRSRGDSLQRKKRVRVLAPPKPVPEADRTHGVVSREVKVNNICVKVTEYRLKPEFFEHFKVPEKVKILSPIKLPTTHTPTPTAHANSARGRIKTTKNGSNRRRPP